MQELLTTSISALRTMYVCMYVCTYILFKDPVRCCDMTVHVCVCYLPVCRYGVETTYVCMYVRMYILFKDPIRCCAMTVSMCVCYPCVGTVLKLLQRIDRETDIRVDVIDVTFPIKSQESVRI